MIPVLRMRWTSLRERELGSGSGLAAAARSCRQLTARGLGWMVAIALAMVPLAGCGIISGSNAAGGASGQQAMSTPPAAIRLSQFATLRQVELAVGRAERITAPPSGVEPSLQVLANYGDFGDSGSSSCPGVTVNMSSVDVRDCIFGDVNATQTMVLTGDSRAQMWFDAIDAIAAASKYRLVFLAKSGCPVPLATYEINNDGTLTNAPWAACSSWHEFVIATIKSLAPRLVIVSSSAEMDLAAPAHVASASEETADTLAFLHRIQLSAKVVVLGGFPQPGATVSPTLCISRNPGDVAKCAYEPSPFIREINSAFRQAAREAHVGYINQEPWLCQKVCPAVIANVIPYTIDGYHIDNTYAQYLTGVLWSSLKRDLS
jgi:SGNH domain-containing protein